MSIVISESCNSTFSNFHETSEGEIQNVIKSLSNATCKLDPLPTSMFKDCQLVLIPVITKLVNTSLQTGVVPSNCKHSLLTPRLKKSDLPSQELSSYRPIANLSYLSKIIEKVAVKQVQEYLTANDLYPRTQSAYRCFHSVETALLRVENDLLLALDEHKDAVLVLLDFSAAFDTISHENLLRRLNNRFGITGTALEWFGSYFYQRSHAVKVEDSLSAVFQDKCGVPQGSVIGPVSFTLYTAPIQDIIDAHELNGMIYADDTQIYAFFDHNDSVSQKITTDRLNACIRDIRTWATHNELVLNDNKTEMVHLSSKFISRALLDVTISVGNTPIIPSKEARNLGCIFDEHLTMKSHVKKVCSSAMSALRQIGKIRGYLDETNTKRLIHSLVTSRLDSCNTLLKELPSSEIDKIQRIQNTAARIVEGSSHRSPIAPLLQKLHWLPIEKRIKFKIILLTFKLLSGSAPSYLTDLIHTYVPSRSLRSENQHLLQVPRFTTEHYGKRSFAVLAPTLWNNIPLCIRTEPSISLFISKLKTHLFTN